jgi:hypothetical protein
MVNKSKKINADFDTLRTQASIRMPQHTTQPAFTSRRLSDPEGWIEGHITITQASIRFALSLLINPWTE